MELKTNPARVLRRATAMGLIALACGALMAEPVAAASTLCPLPSGTVVLCVANFGSPLLALSAVQTATSTVVVETWRYQFPVPVGGTVVTAPCMRVLIDNTPAGPSPNDSTIDPCAGAGGTGIVRLDSQGPFGVALPTNVPGAIAFLVPGELTATVSGFGVIGAPVVVLCSNPTCSAFP